MTELRPQGRDLLAAARLERTPSARDRERVFAAVIAGSATVAGGATAAPSLAQKLLGAGKWWLLGGLTAPLALGGFLASAGSASHPATATRVAATAVVPAPAVLTPEPARIAEPTASAHPAAAAPSAAPVKRGSSPAPSLEEELAQLHAAHAAYRDGQATRALSLIAAHKQRFPKSQLSSERATLEVLALCSAGRHPQARQLADRLRAASKGSAALSGLEGSCAAPPRQ